MTTIMQIGDYISSKTVQGLTPAQYQKFREYLRAHGFSVDDELGTYEKATMYTNEALYLDRWGDLIWRRDSVIGSGREITVDEIFKVIQTNDDSVMTTDKRKLKHPSSIMQVGDYISVKTIEELTPNQYDEFREYLRQCGYSVGPKFGNYLRPAGNNTEFVWLDYDGDLSWCYKGTGKEITANEILDVIQSMKPLTTSKYFVMRIHNSIPIVNCDTQSHATEELARTAAEKIAKENPTQKFCVLKYCGEVQACGVEWN